MEIPLISNKQFNRFRKHLPPVSKAEKIPAIIVLSCVIWVIKYGVPWPHVPEKYGKFDTIRKRFSRWSKNGIFRSVFQSLALKADKSNTAMFDSTTINVMLTGLLQAWRATTKPGLYSNSLLKLSIAFP